MGQRTMWGVLAALLLWSAAAARGNEADLRQLAGKTIDLETATRKYLTAVTVDRVLEEKDRVTGVSVRVGKKLQTIPVHQIVEIYVDAKPLDLEYDTSTKVLGHSTDKERRRLEYEAAVSARLAETKRKLWPRLTDAQMRQGEKEHFRHIEEVRELFPELRLAVKESQYYILCSDMPSTDLDKSLAALDALYDSLCDGFEIPRGRNIWYGKCVVHAFTDRSSFLKWEQHYYKGGDTKATGKTHGNSETGRVIISAHRAADFPNFAGLMTHETTHGFYHRYLSTASLPKWLNEGIADWASETVVPQITGPRRKQLQALDYCRKNGTLPEDFFSEIEIGWRYGMGTNLARFLQKTNETKYREFIVGIKEGYPAEESLMRTFEWDLDDLLKEYGKSIGVPTLKLEGR